MKRPTPFTLLEVVISIAVLGLSLGAVLTLTVSAQNRMIRAETDWRETHLFMQAAEYYLLCGEDAGAPPAEIFPAGTGYTPKADHGDAEDLPGAFDSANLYALRRCTIELERDSDRKSVYKITVDRHDTAEAGESSQ